MLKVTKILDLIALAAVLVSSLALHDNPWSKQILVVYAALAVMTATRLFWLVKNNSKANLIYICMSILAAALTISSQTLVSDLPGRLDILISDLPIELIGVILVAGLVFYAWGQTTLNIVKKTGKHLFAIYAGSYLTGALTLYPLIKVGEKLDLFRLSSPGQTTVAVLIWTAYALMVRWLGSVLVGRRNAKADWAPIAAYFMILSLIL